MAKANTNPQENLSPEELAKQQAQLEEQTVTLMEEQEKLEKEKAEFEAEKARLAEEKEKLEKEKQDLAAAKTASTPATPTQHKNFEQQFTDDAKKTGYLLSQQPKVTLTIPLSEGEKEGAYDEAIINGYRYVVMKGVVVEVPQAVAEIILNKYKIQTAMSQFKSLDRTEVKDGISIQEALS